MRGKAEPGDTVEREIVGPAGEKEVEAEFTLLFDGENTGNICMMSAETDQLIDCWFRFQFSRLPNLVLDE